MNGDSSAETTDATDAVRLLTSDHRAIEQLFSEYETLGNQGGSERKRELVDTMTRELSVHATIEEQVLYPAVRRSLPAGNDLASESLDEHQGVKETLKDLARMSAGEEGFDDKVRALIQHVRHHVQEEEGEMFPKLRAVIPQDQLADMGRTMARAKRLAPTRPHPRAPNTPPANLIMGPPAALLDRMRDAVRRNPAIAAVAALAALAIWRRRRRRRARSQ